ncbi:hypothetical protein AB0G81_09775 [Streptomyces asoensis]|uniref:hypothetical protein n=1 Tax=Streptomyces asoensis TaxID=249586 RepID=UPI0033C631C3
MADKRDRWLDRETAERLLRGESPDTAVGGPAADEAERLSRTLGALAASAAGPLPADEELPGEAAALAAFRKAHADRADLARTTGPADRTRPTAAGAAVGEADGTAAGPPPVVYADDAQLVRIGARTPPATGRRWSRPVRLGLAAALTAGMVGGIAAATGVLPTPFDGAGPARPAASVPAAVPTDGHFPASPAPQSPSGGPGPSAPAGGTGATGRGDTGGGSAGEGSAAVPGARGAWPSGVPSSCRDLSAGRGLDTERRRTLEQRAGGPGRVPAYCAGVLDGTPHGNSRGDDRTPNGTAGRPGGSGGQNQDGRQGHGGGPDDRGGSDDKGGSGGGSDDDEDGGRGGHGGGHGDGHGGGAGDGRQGIAPGRSGHAGRAGHSGGAGHPGGAHGRPGGHGHQGGHGASGGPGGPGGSGGSGGSGGGSSSHRH